MTSSTIRHSRTERPTKRAPALYHALRAAFPDFHAVIHWQTADGDHHVQDLSRHTQRGVGSHRQAGRPPISRRHAGNGKITEHWVANLFSLMVQRHRA